MEAITLLGAGLSTGCPSFSDSVHDCYAVSLLGQGDSNSPAGYVPGDIADFINANLKSPSILLGYSFGGLIIQYYIANLKNDQLLGRGNLYPELTGAVLVCSVPPSGNSYQELIKESSRIPLFDLRKLNASLPVPSVPKSSVELLVLGAKDDFIADREGLKETGKLYGVSPIGVEGVAHDIMLDCLWEKGAKVILSWRNGLKQNVPP